MAEIKHYTKRLESLRTERTSFLGQWRELADNILGYRGRFLVTDRNKGHKRNTKQYNNTPKRAVRTLQSGLMAGATSPARPWFRLQTTDPRLREMGAVKRWIETVEAMIREILHQSNMYRVLSQCYGDLGVFGTAPIALYENFNNVVRGFSFPVGSYMLSNDGEGNVNSIYREYQLRAGQVIEFFGKDNVSQNVMNLWNSNPESWVDVCHAIEPNDDRNGASPLNTDMPFRSVYWEKGKDRQADKLLGQRGFQEFPVMAPRWDVTGEDVYATDCPGMTAIGDCKALQTGEVKKAKGIGKSVDPPLQAPSSMKGRRISLIEGDVSYIDGAMPGQKIESIYNVNLDLNAMQQEIAIIEDRIDKAFFVDLFLMINSIGNRDRVTAEEIAKRHEEKLLMLGPMYERMEDELLSPMIDRLFNMAVRADIVPTPPREIQEQELRVEYISILAQAQKAVATSVIERTATFIGNMAAIDPEAVDKFDTDQAIDEYAEAIGSPSSIVLSDEKVAERRASRQQQQQLQQAAAAAEAAVPATEAVKNLAQAETSGNNALTDMLAMNR